MPNNNIVTGIEKEGKRVLQMVDEITTIQETKPTRKKYILKKRPSIQTNYKVN